jgi:hypothetical protein
MQMTVTTNCIVTFLVVCCMAHEIESRNNSKRTHRNSLLGCPSGKQALDQLRNTSSGMKRLSKSLAKSEAEIQRLFERDSTLRLDENWNRTSGTAHPKVFFVESVTSTSYSSEVKATMFFDSISTESVFSLHSRAESSKTIYLDFTGRNVTNSAWNRYISGPNGTIVAPPFDMDHNPSNFSMSERDIIAEIWQRVSEDFSPFDVDVTTEYRGSEDFLTRTNLSDSEYGVRVLITPIPDIICDSLCGGIAYLDTFQEVGADPSPM